MEEGSMKYALYCIIFAGLLLRRVVNKMHVELLRTRSRPGG